MGMGRQSGKADTQAERSAKWPPLQMAWIFARWVLGVGMTDRESQTTETKAQVAREVMEWMKLAIRDASYKAPEQMTASFVDARYFSAMRDYVKAWEAA